MPPPPSLSPDQGRVSPAAKSELVAHWVGALAWNGMFGTLAVLILLDELQTTAPLWDRLLVALAALGPLLLVRAVVESLRAWRYRGLELRLDPPEGSLGGDLGGTLVVPVPARREDRFRITVSCISVHVGNDSRRESVLWSQDTEPRVLRTGRGVDLAFAVPLPSELPASSAGDASLYWSVRVVGDVPGLDLDAAFTVPVVAHETPLRSSLKPTPPSTGPDLPPGHGIRVDRDAGALVFHYGIRRSLGMGIAFAAFGAVFLASGTFFATVSGVWGDAWSGGIAAVVGLFGLFFLVVFGVAGLLLLLLGLWLSTNTLRVEVTPGSIRVQRRVLGLGRTREVSVPDVRRVEAKVTSQSGQGARATVGYRIVAHTTRGRVTLGDGIRGAGLLERIMALLERQTGLTVERTLRSRPGDRSSRSTSV